MGVGDDQPDAREAPASRQGAYVASSHGYGQVVADKSQPLSSATCPSSDAHILDTLDLLIDVTPSSEAMRSTFLLETPFTHISHVAPARAVSVPLQRSTTSSGK